LDQDRAELESWIADGARCQSALSTRLRALEAAWGGNEKIQRKKAILQRDREIAAGRLSRDVVERLLEKEKLPRYKACGGALVGRALAALPFPAEELGPILERRVSHLRLTHNLAVPLALAHPTPVLALAMRSLFDDAIARRADDTSTPSREQRIERGSESRHPCVRARLVGLHHAAIANHVRA